MWANLPPRFAMSSASPAKDPRAAFLSDPEVLEALRRAVSKVVRRDDVDDIVQGALVSALADASYPPERGAFVAWLVARGRSRAIDHLRKKSRHDRVVEGAPEGDVDALQTEAPGAASGTHDILEAVRFTRKRLAEHAADPGAAASVRWLSMHLRGVPYDEIGEQEGVGVPAVRQAVSRLKRRLHAAWITAAAAILLFFGARALLERRQNVELAHPAPPPSEAPSALPAPSASVRWPTPEEVARDLRRDGVRECGEQKWAECWRDLDRAYQVDPAGEDSGTSELRRKAAGRLAPPAPPDKKQRPREPYDKMPYQVPLK
jgi:RNA polymerase sigma factor (sigma-70 family)